MVVNKFTDMTIQELKYGCKIYHDMKLEQIKDTHRQNGILYVPIDIWRNQKESNLKNLVIDGARDLMKDNNLSEEVAVEMAIISLIGTFFQTIEKKYNCVLLPYKVTTNTFHCKTYIKN